MGFSLGSITGSLSDGFGLFDSNKSKTTSGTETTSIDEEGLAYLFNSILSSTSGLAAVSSGKNAAGLYGGATNELLTNDLLARAAGEVAARNTVKTTTNKETQSTPGFFSNLIDTADKGGGMNQFLSTLFGKGTQNDNKYSG